MKIRVLHNLNYVDVSGVIHELHVGEETDVAPADLPKCGSNVEVLEPVTVALEEPVADKMVRRTHNK